ncbi:McrBC 5-methylcytosine restriction system component [Streptococcus pneumoniae]|nr:McrBC 5-methylcytosine restriction system component [Streptococcus pneumoniae]VIR93927.1 McrBC 5-methylcytosine restriction system component [Streptococcus pneumoniae]VJR28814.1 McrBC 5-methylcytosine restriction system component [Streptococcus pneumoniae]VJV53772.1 McrBC 5-methylcytosine restriction system component [Streptococcus pneumoniae]VKE77103.1 McrBC 5-methylcytosine restriction system component [Streptococcus pneumoniae]
MIKLVNKILVIMMRITDNQYKIIKEKFVEEYPKLSNLLLDRTLESLSQDERIFIFPNDLTHPKFQVEVSHPKEIHLATCSPSIF